MGIHDYEETVSIEDYDVVVWDNKRMATFLVSLGLEDEDIGDLIVDGTNDQRDEARELIKRKING